jgi:hypothetical protein
MLGTLLFNILNQKYNNYSFISCPFPVRYTLAVCIGYDFFDRLLEAGNIPYGSHAAMNKPKKRGIYDLKARAILGMIC